MRRAIITGIVITALTASASAKCLVSEVAQDQRYGPVVTFTPARPSNAHDRKRAAGVLVAARAILRTYRDPAKADAAGYLSYNHFRTGRYDEIPRAGARRLNASFDVRFPAALVYLPPSPAHGPILAGALYTSDAVSNGDSLDRLVPLSVARWIRIRNRCSAPLPSPWALEIFAFERDGPRVWQVPDAAAYFVPYAPAPTASLLHERGSR